MRVHGLTCGAPRADVNEDALLVDVDGGVFVVADGLSGCPAGDVASRVAVEAFAQALASADGDGLVAALQHANDEVVRAAGEDQAFDRMCAAVTAARLGADGRGTLVHAGDCRAYLLRDGALRMLTEDHLVVREGQRQITKVVGRARAVEPDKLALVLGPGDRLLLCTDGLTKVVTDEAIEALLAAAPDPEAACTALMKAAVEGDTPDDVTLIALWA